MSVCCVCESGRSGGREVCEVLEVSKKNKNPTLRMLGTMLKQSKSKAKAAEKPRNRAKEPAKEPRNRAEEPQQNNAKVKRMQS